MYYPWQFDDSFILDESEKKKKMEILCKKIFLINLLQRIFNFVILYL